MFAAFATTLPITTSGNDTGAQPGSHEDFVAFHVINNGDRFMNHILRLSSSAMLGAACVVATADFQADAQSSNPSNQPVQAAEPGTTAAGRTQAQRASDVINVQDFGAVPDFNWLGGCAYYTAAGSTTLSASCNGFSSSMVGKVLIVPGAGANNGPLMTTIAGVTDQSHLVMGAAAATTYANGVPAAPEFGTDNTAAINNAIAAAVAQSTYQQTNGTQIAADVFFPGGNGSYGVTSVNMTGIKSSGLMVSGSGVIWGFGNNVPVVDALGSSWIRWDGVGIIGDYYSVPSSGLQIGRVNSTGADSSDNSYYSRMLITGGFQTAALLNEQSETTKFEHDHFYNHAINASLTYGTYAVAMDGAHHLSTYSAVVNNKPYETNNEPMNQGESFGENQFDDCIFGSYVPLFIGGTNKMNVVSSYSTSSGPYGAILFSEPGIDNLNLHLDLHMEGVSAKTVTDDFLIDGAQSTVQNGNYAPTPYMPGFQWRENGSVATNSMFKLNLAASASSTSGVLAASMSDAEVQVDLANYGATKMFNDPAKCNFVNGRFLGPTSTFMNLAYPAFQGTYTNGNMSTLSYSPLYAGSVAASLASTDPSVANGWTFNEPIYSNQNLQLGSGKALNLYNSSFNGGAPCYLDMGSNGQITCADGQVESWLLGATTAKSLTVAQGSKVNLDSSGNLAIEEDTNGNAVILTGSGARLLSINATNGNVIVKGTFTSGNP